MSEPNFEKTAGDLVEAFKRAAFDRMMHIDGCPEGEQIKAGIAAIAPAIYRAGQAVGLEMAADIAQTVADENIEVEQEPFMKSMGRAIRRITALKMRERIMQDDPRGNARLSISNSALERCARVAEGYGWTGRESTHCDSHEEGRRDAADSIAAAIRALKVEG